MTRCACLLMVIASLAMIESHAQMPACEPIPGRHVVSIRHSHVDESDWFSRLLRSGHPVKPARLEVSGTNAFYEVLDNGWVFALMPQPYGWSIRLFDRSGGIDLTQSTPPLRAGVANPRDIYGWHFRSADNLAPNTGEVNAPQQLRLFSFATWLAGTGGYKPAPGGSAEDLASDGRGWLFIHDLGLADLGPGQRARANYLQFSVCLSWSAHQGPSQLDAYDKAHQDQFADCGLDLRRFRMDAVVNPALMELDINGDGVLDQLAQVIDHEAGTRDLVLCHAGTALHHVSSLSFEGDYEHGFAAMERWSVRPADFVPPGTPGGDTTWPAADGDVVVLERIEKSMYLLFMQGGKLRTQRVFRHVEP